MTEPKFYSNAAVFAASLILGADAPDNDVAQLADALADLCREVITESVRPSARRFLPPSASKVGS